MFNESQVKTALLFNKLLTLLGLGNKLCLSNFHQVSTELQAPNERGGGINRQFIRDGIAGNYDVIYEMARVIRHAVKYDKGLEHYAKQLLISHNLNSYSDPAAICQVIFDSLKPQYDAQGFIASGVAYIQDIAGRVETIKAPRETLSDAYGDCDDQAILIAALLGCVGFEDVRIAMAKYTPNDPTFSHVYCIAYKDGKRFVLDPTLPSARMNFEVKPYEIKEVSIFDPIEGLDGFSGAYNNVRYHGRKFAKAAIEALPAAAESLPLGFIVANTFATGADLLNRSQGVEQLSYNAAASKVNKQIDEIIRRLVRSEIALDNAQARAAFLVAQLGTIQTVPTDRRTHELVQQSLRTKLNFIKNFESYAAAKNIKVVYLDSRAMAAVGIVAIGAGGYIAYKRFFGSK